MDAASTSKPAFKQVCCSEACKGLERHFQGSCHRLEAVKIRNFQNRKEREERQAIWKAEQEAIRKGLCLDLMRSGTCRFGAACRFLHEDARNTDKVDSNSKRPPTHRPTTKAPTKETLSLAKRHSQPEDDSTVASVGDVANDDVTECVVVDDCSQLLQLRDHMLQCGLNVDELDTKLELLKLRDQMLHCGLNVDELDRQLRSLKTQQPSPQPTTHVQPKAQAVANEVMVKKVQTVEKTLPPSAAKVKKVQTGEKTLPPTAAKEVQKMEKKLRDIAKIEACVAAGDSVDALQIQKVAQKDELLAQVAKIRRDGGLWSSRPEPKVKTQPKASWKKVEETYLNGTH